jgi:hypothetical protein
MVSTSTFKHVEQDRCAKTRHQRTPRQPSLGNSGAYHGSAHRPRLLIAALISVILGIPIAALSAEQRAQPATTENPTEPFQVEGFRSAHWGMTDAQVKAAIKKDFNIPPEKVQTEENPSERTTVLAITANDVLEGAGKARISYILGYSGKKLIQVNIVWGSTVDPQTKADRIVAAANQLRALFLSSSYQADTVASNVATADGTITVFQGQDAEKRMTLLRLVSTPPPPPPKGGKAEAGEPRVVLFLSYVLDPRTPDVYRLKKGQF